MHALKDVLGGALVWDNHACMPLDPRDLSLMDELRCCHAAGVDVVSLNVASGDQSAAEAAAMLTAFDRWIDANADWVMPVRSAADAIAACERSRLGVCFDVEGMAVLEGRLENIGSMYDRGVRWMLSAYNTANAVGGGCLDAEDGGLTEFGRSVVAEMNTVGMVVCASHAGPRTARELIDASSAPTVFSHSNAAALWPTARNIDDEAMIACAARGGVVGLNGIGAYLGRNDDSAAAFVRHVVHVLDLIGEDHVGIALDYCYGCEGGMQDFIAEYPALFPPEHGYATAGMRMIAPWRLGDIAEALVARGASATTLAKLFGGNHLRIARTVWR